MWLSLVERHVRDVEVAGSNPVISTNRQRLHPASGVVVAFFYYTMVWFDFYAKKFYLSKKTIYKMAKK